MKQIVVMALKDLKIVFRDRMSLFFIVGFPVVMGLFFGLVMGGLSSGSSGKIRIALVDQDQSEVSQKFIQSLNDRDGLSIETIPVDEARESVRKGQRTAMIVVKEGFGVRAGILWGVPPQIQLVHDDSRAAESAMLQGYIMQAIGQLIGERFRDPVSMLPSLDQSRTDMIDALKESPGKQALATNMFDSIETVIDSVNRLRDPENADASEPEGDEVPNVEGAGSTDNGEGVSDVDENALDSGAGSMKFADIQTSGIHLEPDPGSVAGQLKKRKSRWDISFPQAMLWGVLSCVTGFAISIARERSMGTYTRLKVAPINKSGILLGKALACFIASVAVVAMMTALGLMLGMRPYSYPKLIAASLCTAAAFTGLMMIVSVLGKTEQSVSGASTAVIMTLAMLGGCMIPAVLLPGFLQTASFVSPVRWAIMAIEGAVWRQFSWAEMMLPLVVLIVCAVVFFGTGARLLNRGD